MVHGVLKSLYVHCFYFCQTIPAHLRRLLVLPTNIPPRSNSWSLCMADLSQSFPLRSSPKGTELTMSIGSSGPVAMDVLRSLLTVGRWIAVIFCSSILLHVIFPTDNPMPFNPRVVLIYSVILAFPYGFIWKTIKRSFQGPPINPIGPVC
jgi:hypothetical protein